jgi:hypothetical protein
MHLTEEKKSLKFIAAEYSLVFVHDRPYVYVNDSKGVRLAELFVLSSIHPLHCRDDATWSGAWAIDEGMDEYVFTLESGSSCWQKKIYRFRCSPESFRYEVEVEGEGLLAEALYFGGLSSAQLRWGSGFFWSGQRFDRAFTPEPNSRESIYFSPSTGSSVGLTGVPLPGRGDWFFTPPPFCFCYQKNSSWLAIGVEARAGENLFSEFAYRAGNECFHMALMYDGMTKVSGTYQLPSIGFHFAGSEYAALQAHVDSLDRPAHPAAPLFTPKPEWWSEPIFCGWGEQCYLAESKGSTAPDYSKQSLYESYMGTLEENGILPGIVVLDDKWQATYGDNEPDLQKWPDLPGFVGWQHAQNRRVLLWLKAWDPEGVPAEECVTNSVGKAVSVDPTNPAFQKRLRESVHRMLSADGYDADGFKIDFTARIPSGPGLSLYGTVWGLELMKLFLWIIYDEAKKAKPDALIMTHTPHPYLAGVTDMIRLNDINIEHDVITAMTHRARIASIACPQALIDTDNWPMPGRKAWRRYLDRQPELGVPSLYFVTHIDSTCEALTSSDYALIRKVWARYRERSQKGSPTNGKPVQPSSTNAVLPAGAAVSGIALLIESQAHQGLVPGAFSWELLSAFRTNSF